MCAPHDRIFKIKFLKDGWYIEFLYETLIIPVDLWNGHFGNTDEIKIQ